MQEQTKLELLKIAADLAAATANSRKDGVAYPGQAATTLPAITAIFEACLAQVLKSFDGLGGSVQ